MMSRRGISMRRQCPSLSHHHQPRLQPFNCGVDPQRIKILIGTGVSRDLASL
jgi:hypothetical protein